MSKTNTVPRAGAWTDGEKARVLFSIIFSMVPKIEWSKVPLPEGRDVKSVQNMLDGEKRRHGISRANFGKEKANAAPITPGPDEDNHWPKAEGDDGGDGGTEQTAPLTPKATPKRASRKRKLPASATDVEVEEGGSNDTEHNVPSAPKKKVAKPRKKQSPKTSTIDVAIGTAVESGKPEAEAEPTGATGKNAEPLSFPAVA